MYQNGYSIRVPQGRELDGGYVELRHQQQYTFQLRNNQNTRCDVELTIDGKPVGKFRLNARASFTLERPAHDRGLFTFYSIGSPEFSQTGLDQVSRSELGLIKAVFTPEKEKQHWTFMTAAAGTPQPPSITEDWSEIKPATKGGGITRGSHKAGGTGLSGHSSQEFVNVAELDYDITKQTVIHLRLIERDGDPRPLTAYSTPVPPPVD